MGGSIMATIISTKTSGVGGLEVTGDATGILQLASNNGTTAITVDASQNVGIGTASPAYKLDISSTAPLRVQSGATQAAAFEFCGNNATYGTSSLFVGQGGDNIGYLYQRASQPVVIATNATERMRITSDGLLQFNNGYGSVATAYGCRAWVNFNGTGTVAIRASGNVSSISDNGTGNYTINFSNDMPDANYTTVATCASDTDGYLKVVALNSRSGSSVNPTTTAQRIYTRVSGTNTDSDSSFVEVSIFR